MPISRQHTLSLLIALLPALLPSPALATPEADVGLSPGHSVSAERRLPLAWRTISDTQLLPVASAWQPLANVHFSAAADPDGAAHPAGADVRTGPLAWSITPGGTILTDTRTGRWARIPVLTSDEVRPRDLVYDPSSATVWLYGDSLYRYRTDRHVLERLAPGAEGWRALRKIALGPAGLWLAAESGIYLLDAREGSLTMLKAGSRGAGIVNLVATNRDAWFATGDNRLIHVVTTADGRRLVATVATLPGVPAEMAMAGNSLWLLMGGRHGDYYTLASLAGNRDTLGIYPGRYYSLSSQDSRLIAGAYATTYLIDPAGNAITPVKATLSGALARAARNVSVLYAGSSYDVRDGCEVVEHAQLDISKGWTSAMGEPVPR